MADLIDTRTVAERAGKSVWTVARWVRSGQLVPRHTVGSERRVHTYLFDPADVDRFLSERADDDPQPAA